MVNDITFSFFQNIQSPVLTQVMYFVTDFGVLFLLALVGIVAIYKKQYTLLIYMAVASMAAFEITFLLKQIFQIPRPYVVGIVDPIYFARGSSFPSIHAAFVFSLLLYQRRLFGRWFAIPLYVFIFIIALSRVYLGAHYLTDIIAGGVIGLLVAGVFIYLKKKFEILKWFINRVQNKLELRRQTAHFVLGVIIVFLFKLGLINSTVLFAVTIIGGILVVIAKQRRLPIIHDVLEYFERPEHMKRFPGRGSFFLMLGAALATHIFDPEIAMAAIMIMAVGDSVTNIIGKHFGKIENPFNAKKNLEGTFWAIITSTLAAFIFVPLWPAFAAATVAMVVESLDFGWKRIQVEFDDNVVIPLVAGAIITLLI